MSRSSPPPARRIVRSFIVTDELWSAFTERAAALHCSTDWLVGEAMKRLLETVPKPEPDPTMRVRPARPPSLPLPPARLPPPPQRVRRSTGPRPTRIALVATSSDPAHDGASTRSVVEVDRFVIGRSAKTSKMVLADAAVSRQHAIIERTAEGYVLVDMASRNGVLVNGARVTRAVLRPGDVVAIGPFSLAVERA